MSVEFRDVNSPFSQTLGEVAAALPAERITVRELLTLVGEQGMLLFAMILTIPFLTPIPLPGVSTVFGLIIMLIAIGVVLNRVPWLPGALLKRPIGTTQLRSVLERGAALFKRIEGAIRPRLLALTGNAAANRFNGLMLFIAGFLLILPLPFLPFSNTLPGWAVLLLAAGMLQRDGLFIVLGILLNIVTTIYLVVVAVAFVAAGGTILQFLGIGGEALLLLLR